MVFFVVSSQARLLLAAVAVGSAHALHVPSQGFAPINRANAAPMPSLSTPVLARDARLVRDESSANLRLRGGASASSLVFSLFKAIVGSGVLSLAGGVAAFTNNGAYLPAAVRIDTHAPVFSHTTLWSHV